MIETRFIFYLNKNDFDLDKPEILDNSIAFIADSATIYTHKTEFNCFNENISKETLNKIKFRLSNTIIEYSIDGGSTWETLIDLNSVDWSQVTNLSQTILNIINQNADLTEILNRLNSIDNTISNHTSRISNLENNQGSVVNYTQVGPTDYKIGDLNINGIIKSIFGKNVTGGTGGVSEDWVNSKIQEAIDSIRDLIDSTSTSSDKQTISWWNENVASGNIDPDTIYVITDDTGTVIIGIGIRGILTRIPVAANTVVRCTQSEYDAITTKDPNTIYIITSDDGTTILKMYLGTVLIPFGTQTDINEIVIKSIITLMFSEKITWTNDGKIDKINYTILDVDNPGDFYVTTGLVDIVDGAINTKTSGFLAKSSEDATFASMFAAQVNDLNIAKKAEIIASINASGESNVKINADKIDVNGVLNAGKINADNINGGSIKSSNLFIQDSSYKYGDGSQYPWVVGGIASTLNNTDYALWVGSSIDGDGLTDEEILTDVFHEDTSEIPFKVTRAGKLYAKDAEISGNASISGNIHAKNLYLGEGSIFVLEPGSRMHLPSLSTNESSVVYVVRKPFPNITATMSYTIASSDNNSNIYFAASNGASSTTANLYNEVTVKSDVMCVGYNDGTSTLWRIYELLYAGTPLSGSNFGQ